MNRKRVIGAIAAVVLLGVVGPRADAGSLVNPSFEGGLAGYSASGDASTTGLLPGFDDETDVTPTDGSLFALLTTDGVPESVISQTFDLPTIDPSAGPVVARLSFDWRFMTDELDSGPDFNDSFTATLTPTSGPALSFTFSRDDLQPGGSGPTTGLAIPDVGSYLIGTAWLTHTFDVSALLGQTVTLSFAVSDVGDLGVLSAVALDNIRVDAFVIPEPSGLVLSGLGLAGLGVVLRRSRRRR